MKINPETLEITQLSKFFNAPGILNEIHALSFVEKTYLLISFMKDSKMYLFNYKTGRVNYHFETPQKDKYHHKVVSLQEVMRQDPQKPLKVYETAISSN